MEIDIAVELGCQYPNRKMINYLWKLKKSGSKIYIVSDFYLPQKCYQIFLRHLKTESLFDGIYVSEICNKTKRKGTLFDYVLKELSANPADCLMIGDSRHSDVWMAQKHGIKAKWYFPFRHKVWTNISKQLHLDYGKRIVSYKAHQLQSQSLFGEYVIILYYFIYRLFSQADDDKVPRLSFLSRGGHFLKILFNEYQQLRIPTDRQIESLYCYNSRKVCLAADNSEESCLLLKDYLRSFTKGNKLYVVDEGWYNHSQQAIARTTGLDTYGYYIGTRSKEHVDLPNACCRRGLLFDTLESGKRSAYYGIFCTNCSLYEQMLTANHGSVDRYFREDGIVKPQLKENEKEKMAYERYVREWQESMFLDFQGLTAWLVDKNVKPSALARIMLFTSFFAGKERRAFLNFMDESRFDNCTDGKAKTDKGIKDVRISVAELILHPDRYVGMFSKLQRKLDGKPLLMILYYPVACCFYWYIRLCERI